MTTARIVGIRSAPGDAYAVDLETEDGSRSAYLFPMVQEPIPMITWSEAFDDEIGSFNETGVAILRAVTAFHNLSRNLRVEQRDPGGRW